MTEVGTAYGNRDSLTLTGLQGDTLEALEFLDWTFYLRRRARHIDLSHFFCINGGGIGKYELHVEAFGCRLYVEIAVHELSIGEAKSKGIGHRNLLAVVPAIAYQTLLCIVGYELLPTIITAISGDVNKDVALIVMNVLRIGACGVSRNVF